MAEHEHDWVLVEIQVGDRGADRVLQCACGEESYELGQATRRPPLG